jgi:hypothetical protein
MILKSFGRLVRWLKDVVIVAAPKVPIRTRIIAGIWIRAPKWPPSIRKEVSTAPNAKNNPPIVAISMSVYPPVSSFLDRSPSLSFRKI